MRRAKAHGMSAPPEKRASRARTNIAVRLIGGAMLIYFIVSSLRSDEFSAGNAWQLAIVAVMAVWAAVIIALTVVELIKKLKAGAYLKEYYRDGAEGGAGEDSAPDGPGGGEA
jgi:hypothetical protein